MIRWKGMALLLTALVVAPRVAHTQSADSLPQISLFAGTSLSSYNVTESSIPSLVEGGGSLQLHVRRLPFALRASVAVSQEEPSVDMGRLRYGTLSVDAVVRARRNVFGFRPYAVGGLGVATRAAYTSIVQRYALVDGEYARAYSPSDYVVQERLN